MIEPMRRYILTKVDARERMECRAFMKKVYARYLLYTALYCIAMIIIGGFWKWDLFDLCLELAMLSFFICGMLWSHWVLWKPPTADEMAEMGDEIQ